MTNAELETIFNAVILSDCSRQETQFLLDHPKLRLYLFLWFVRGWEAGNDRFMGMIDQTIKESYAGEKDTANNTCQ